MSVELSASLLAGILGAEVVQVGFQARLLSRQAKLETKLAERTSPNGG